ncbi:MAG TPA: phosphonate ABC transporter, permease protein PhnE [Candidatus Limnocylindria bacterium]|nr:phosphonate ABC transporter, permease protein PhnE [Candidatus Limnocylindria bacterium]
MRPPRVPPRLVLAALAALVVGSCAHLGMLDAARMGRGARNLGEFLAALFPPDVSTLPTLGVAMLETLEIAFVGTALGFLLALPLALLASPILFGPAVTGATKLGLAMVRTVPSLFWAIVFVVAVGLGPAAGALAVALYSLGYLGKLLYETFDAVDPEVIEAIRGAGAGRLLLARYAILPEAANGILAQLLFMFEYNVRASSIIGFVGAGGIGYYMLGYLQVLRYDLLLTALVVTLLVVIAIDRASSLVRRLYLIPVSVPPGE